MKGKGIAALVAVWVAVIAMPAYAQESLSVTVTPPLFQLTIGPGESWRSSLKIVNANPYDVTYYAHPMDFSAQGEGGQGNIVPVIDNPNDPIGNSYSLARWIDISNDPVVVPAGESLDIPFQVTIPADAEPGGHYAAILVGTQPPRLNVAGPRMIVSSYVTSLLFVRVEGDISEKARIREFRTQESLYQTQEAQFLLRFENLGNTHVRPQGIITIYNMWGKKRGELLINQERNFGNVLPDSVRKFEFSWAGDASLFDIGHYRAEVTLNFGEGDKQNVSAVAYFWVVPVVPVATTLSCISVFIALLVWFIRRYIRRALALERDRSTRVQPLRAPAQIPEIISATPTPSAPPVAPQETKLQTFIEPLREGVIDLRRVTVARAPEKTISSSVDSAPAPEPRLSLMEFLGSYRLFFLFIAVMLAAGIGLYLFFAKVLVPESPYEINGVSTQLEE